MHTRTSADTHTHTHTHTRTHTLEAATESKGKTVFVIFQEMFRLTI